MKWIEKIAIYAREYLSDCSNSVISTHDVYERMDFFSVVNLAFVSFSLLKNSGAFLMFLIPVLFKSHIFLV